MYGLNLLRGRLRSVKENDSVDIVERISAVM
jgi:hypothetical protein